MDKINNSMKLKILLADQNEHDNISFINALNGFGLFCDIVREIDTSKIIDLLTLNTANFDIAVIDQKLPQKSGYELCKEIITRKISLPLIMLTNTGSEQLAVSALKIGVDEYIIKDNNNTYLELLPIVILDVLKKHRFKNECMHAEQAREKFVKRNENLLSAIPDIMFLINKYGIFLDYHSSNRESLFIPPNKFLGNSIKDVLPIKIAVEIQKNILKVIHTGDPISFEFDYKLDNNKYFFEARFVPSDKNVLAIIRNITKRKKAEKEKEKLLTFLNEKNTDLEQIINIISHDLRSPLLNINGFINEIDSTIKNSFDLLDNFENNSTKKQIKDQCSRVNEYFNYIKLSLSKMELLLSSLLEISRLGRSDINYKKILMNKLISDILKVFQYQINEKNIQIIINKLPSCYADEIQLNQVFSNIIDNSIKFYDKSKKPFIKISGKKKNDNIVYCIEDNGIGIKKEYQNKIFDIFHRLNPKESNGQGLGLTIVNRIVTRHKGKIWVESSVDEGSKIFISIPINK